MDKYIIDQLLNENESSYLDFKQDQYKFVKANDIEKGELLKDILAFTNAWRRTDAYILIGVKEEITKKSTVLGIGNHLQDHSLQQFVNSKTQEPITFSYNPFDYKGKQIGIICIPVQKRPIYLTDDYGKLKKNLVYIRRGSSTDVATPDEIAKMGSALQQELNQLSIDLQFANVEQNEYLGQSIRLSSTVVKIPNPNNIPDFIPPKNSLNPWSQSLSTSYPIKSYYRDLVNYYETYNLLKPIGFAVKNKGQITARNVRLVISQNKNPKVTILDKDLLPDQPRAYVNIISPITNRTNIIPNFSNTELTLFENKWKLEIKFGDVQPKANAWSDDVLFFGSQENMSYHLDGQIFADNLPNPMSIPLEIAFSIEVVESDIKSIQNIIKEQRKKYLDDLDVE